MNWFLLFVKSRKGRKFFGCKRKARSTRCLQTERMTAPPFGECDIKHRKLLQENLKTYNRNSQIAYKLIGTQKLLEGIFTDPMGI